MSHTIGHSVPLISIATGIVLVQPQFRPAIPLLLGRIGRIRADLLVAYPKFMVNYFWPVLEVAVVAAVAVIYT